MRRLPLPLLLALAASCGSSSEPPAVSTAPSIVLLVGVDVSPAVAERVEELLASVDSRPIVRSPEEIPDGSLVLSFGDTEISRELIPHSELEALGPEGFVLRTGSVGSNAVLAADGNPNDDGFGRGSLGDHFAAYAALEELGFAFLHPLAPTLPTTLPQTAPAVDRSESPHWRIRGMQIHTMHPLELTDVLNGWGKRGTDDRAGWEEMLPDWESTVEWLVANRQNRVHWVLLWGQSWADFAESDERLERLRAVVGLAHDFGVGVGVDVPIALKQQASFRLIRDENASMSSQIGDIHRRVDWVLSAGFDYLATENGTSEFTHPEDFVMLAWMDELARYADEEHGKPVYIKAHASQGQSAENFDDPVTGDPININFLPYYADSRLGVMPHTVQHYALDDLAPTYGNENFGFMRDYLQLEVGRREVIWHPETAYWVSFDIDVPLFLPVYAERRFHDLRLLAEDESSGRMGRGEHAGGRMDGQIVFSSGWEWGYWLGDVIAARAAWDPRLDIEDERLALVAILTDALAPAGSDASALAEALLDIALQQKALLIDGMVAGTAPLDINLRNGQAYLQGSETWDEISKWAGLATGHPVDTQPRKLGLVDMRNPLAGGPDYDTEVEPLLAEMERTLTDHAAQLEAFRARATPSFAPLIDDLAAAAKMNELRARQVHGLYDYVDGWLESGSDRQQRIAVARDALDQALALVLDREKHYRVASDRIAGWRDGPTAYAFGYLWTARSLFYWWRDEGKAYDVPLSPCYMNIISPIDVGFGEGTSADAAETARVALDNLGLTAIGECMSAPEEEPSYPLPGTRP